MWSGSPKMNGCPNVVGRLPPPQDSNVHMISGAKARRGPSPPPPMLLVDAHSLSWAWHLQLAKAIGKEKIPNIVHCIELSLLGPQGSLNRQVLLLARCCNWENGSRETEGPVHGHTAGERQTEVWTPEAWLQSTPWLLSFTCLLCHTLPSVTFPPRMLWIVKSHGL